MRQATTFDETVLSAPDGRWTMHSVRPGADLAGLVLGYQGYVERGGPVLCQREVSTTLIPVVINFGPVFRVDSSGTGRGPEDLRSFVAGLDGGPAAVASTGASFCMQVDFSPPGAYRFFGLPMREFAGDIVPLDALLGDDFRRLADVLFCATDWTSRFALLDGFVRARLRRHPAPSPQVAWAWRQLNRSQGRERIDALAARVGWSRKHLADRFAAEIGRPPKTVARLLRFEHLHGLLGTGETPDWSALAHDCGYADQAHLVREFRHFAGITPGDYMNERRLRD
tara:strand:+ start:96 stop:944 length:849 start_codon:yes stop_codon:yes gene_type:complete